MIGTMISHYLITEKLGVGGMGVVYKAEDTKLKRAVALKFLPPELTGNPTATERFRQEACAASALDHPAICTIHEIDETADGQLFIVMACYEGETLRSRIDRAALTVRDATDIARMVAEGLAEAHRHGIVHRDINPSNILITRDGIVKIVDFGLAKLSGVPKLTRDGVTPGTAAYMSPEQVSDENVDGRADIWALGVVVFEMLTRQLPFHGEAVPAMTYAIMNEPPADIARFRHDLPQSLVEVYQQSVVKDRNRRIQSMEEFLTLLDAQRGPAVRTEIRTPWKFPGIRPVVIGGGALIVIVFAGVLLYRFVMREPGIPSRTRIAVLPFQEAGESVPERGLLTQTLFVNELTGTQDFGVVDPTSLNGLFESAYGTGQPRRDPHFYQLLAEEQIAVAVDGRIIPSAGGYMVQANLVDPASGELYYTSDAEMRNDLELPEVIASLSRQMLGYLDVRLRHSATNDDLRPWLDHRTRDMDALRAFTLASRCIFNGLSGCDAYLRQAIASDSLYISPRVWLISSLVSQGNVDEARNQFGMLVRLTPIASPFEQAMIRWTTAFINGDISGQEQSLQLALDYSPGNNILLFNLARVQYLLGDYDGAIRSIIHTVNMRWQYGPAYYLLGESYRHMKQYDSAEEYLTRALTMKPLYTMTYSVLSALALRNGDTARAGEYERFYFQKSGEGHEPLAGAYAMHGRVYLDEGMFDKAVANTSLAVALRPEDPDFFDQLGESYYGQRKIDSARAAYARALELDSTRVNALRMLGRIEEENGQIHSAIRFYEAFRRRDSTSTDAEEVRQRLARLRR